VRKIIVSIFLVFNLLSSTAMSETAADWFHKADALSDGKKYTDPTKAIEYLNNGIKLQPDSVDAYNNRGLAYGKLGQYQRAIEDFNKAIRLKPDYPDAYCNRGFSYVKLKQNQRAIKDFNKAIHLKPDYANAYSNRGTVYLMQDNKELGCPDAQKACDLGNCKLLEMAKSKGLCRLLRFVL